MKLLRVEPIDRGKPQWKFAAPGIKCAADWYMKHVFVYDVDGKEVACIAQDKKEAKSAIISGMEIDNQPPVELFE